MNFIVLFCIILISLKKILLYLTNNIIGCIKTKFLVKINICALLKNDNILKRYVHDNEI